jgi:hypothetical protein
MDLGKWEKQAKIPEYKPPQLEKNWIRLCKYVNWYGIRSPICPSLAYLIKTCIFAKDVNFNNPDSWIEPLMRSIHPTCPPEFQGIYWLRDHIQPTALLTLHDSVWTTPFKTRRALGFNWVRSNTLWGTLSSLLFLVGNPCFDMSVELSPNKKWFLVKLSNIEIYWMYVFQSDTVIIRKTDGQKINVYKGDVMRIDFKNWKDSNSRVTYMYLIQRIVIPMGGKYIKTPNYTEFMKRVNKENKEPYFQRESIIRNDTLMNEQHTIGFTPQYMER